MAVIPHIRRLWQTLYISTRGVRRKLDSVVLQYLFATLYQDSGTKYRDICLFNIMILRYQ